MLFMWLRRVHIIFILFCQNTIFLLLVTLALYGTQMGKPLDWHVQKLNHQMKLSSGVCALSLWSYSNETYKSCIPSDSDTA